MADHDDQITARRHILVGAKSTAERDVDAQTGEEIAAGDDAQVHSWNFITAGADARARRLHVLERPTSDANLYQ